MLESWKSATAAVRAGRAEANEVRLLAQAERGDRAAFAQLYRAYFPRLARFLDRMSRDGALIEEVINDTMLVVWQKADTFNHTSKVSTWIFAIAYRKALKALERLDEPLEDDDADLRWSAEPGPEQQLGLQQLQLALQRALAGLSAEQRAVVALTYFHGADYREIAQIVDCPVDTVKTRMFHARRRLKTLLGGQLEDWQ